MRNPGYPGQRMGVGWGRMGPFGTSSTGQARLESSGIQLCTHALAPHPTATVRYSFPLLPTTSLAATLNSNAGSAHTKGGQVMFRPQPLHQHPSLGNCAHRDARKPTLLCCTSVAAWVDCGPRALQEGWLRNSCWMLGSALAKGGQVMFCPQPLHQLPGLGNCAHRCFAVPHPSWLAAGLLLDAGSA